MKNYGRSQQCDIPSVSDKGSLVWLFDNINQTANTVTAIKTYSDITFTMLLGFIKNKIEKLNKSLEEIKEKKKKGPPEIRKYNYSIQGAIHVNDKPFEQSREITPPELFKRFEPFLCSLDFSNRLSIAGGIIMSNS